MRLSIAALGLALAVSPHTPQIGSPPVSRLAAVLHDSSPTAVRRLQDVQPSTGSATGRTTTGAAPGVRLEDLTWREAQELLGVTAVVVLPLGAGAKEHGPHLKLRNDLTIAEYLAGRAVATSKIVVAPPFTYAYDPGFLEYPGSTSLALGTARDMTAEIVRSLARYGPRRFYAINTGTATTRAMEAAARALASEGILLRYTDFEARLRQASQTVAQQNVVGHADEIETSLMLYIDPSAVDMRSAARDLSPRPAGTLRLTRDRAAPGTYSPTGVWGDPTLATRDKGRIVTESLVSAVLQDIEDLRTAPLPAAAAPAQRTAARGGGPTLPAQARILTPGGCTPGDERDIRSIGDAFAYYWVNGDAIQLGGLWSREGDMVHPDGTIERGSQVIIQNRMQLFLQRQYQGTRHPLTISMIRCLSPDIAVADGKWELRGLTDNAGQPLPTLEGLCTLVVKKSDKWLIEAYRYTIKTPARNVPPTLLDRPGWPVIRK